MFLYLYVLVFDNYFSYYCYLIFKIITCSYILIFIYILFYVRCCCGCGCGCGKDSPYGGGGMGGMKPGGGGGDGIPFSIIIFKFFYLKHINKSIFRNFI